MTPSSSRRSRWLRQDASGRPLPALPSRSAAPRCRSRRGGLEPLADALLANPMLNPDEEAANYLREPFTTEQGDNPGVADARPRSTARGRS